MYHPSFGKLETTTGSELTSVKLNESSIEVESFDTTNLIQINERNLQLAAFLMERADEPYLAKEIKRTEPSIKGSIALKFNRLMKELEESNLKEHFTSFGSGSATWYGFVTHANIVGRATFVETGIKKVKHETSDEKKLQKRLKPFHAYEKLLLDGEQEPYFTRNRKIAGASAIAITIGAATVLATRHFKN